MSTFLLKFRPLEPYFFGEEKNLGFDNMAKGPKKVLTNAYFIKSGNMPSPSTLIGAIRYLALKQTVGLSSDGVHLTDEQRTVIGDSSFDLLAEGRQEFGTIKSLGPVHLCKGNTEYFKTPYFLHKNEAFGIASYRMEQTGERKHRPVYLPTDYDGKEGQINGYISSDDEKELVQSSEIFGSVIKTRILKDKRKENQQDAFFKKEYRILADGFSFCCEAEIDGWTPKSDVVYMGQDKSSFAFTAVEKGAGGTEIGGMKKLCEEKADVPPNSIAAIALSDIYFTEPYEQATDFAIASFRNFRFMTSAHESTDQSYYARLKKSCLYHLAEAGSTFYLAKDQLQAFQSFFNPDLSSVGLNTFIYVEGRNHS